MVVLPPATGSVAVNIPNAGRYVRAPIKVWFNPPVCSYPRWNTPAHPSVVPVPARVAGTAVVSTTPLAGLSG